jgi:acetyl esterase/lipase
VPVVLAIHGGAFIMGDRTWELAALPALLAAGFAVASIEYRLSGEAPFPAAICDVKRATAFLRRNADRWHLDPEFFAAWGRAAGGYLAAMLGITGSMPTEFDAPGADNPGADGPPGDSRVSAVVDWNGLSDFLAMDAQFTQDPPTADGPLVQSHAAASSPESRFLGAPITDVPDLARRANPITYIPDAAHLPPFFLAAGTNDRLVPYQQTLILADALRTHGGEVVLQILHDASHADQQFETQLIGPVINWLNGLRAVARSSWPATVNSPVG